jgi:hypothetical protein
MFCSLAFTVRNQCYRFATASSFYKQKILPAMDGYCSGARKNRLINVGGRCDELRPARFSASSNGLAKNAVYADTGALPKGRPVVVTAVGRPPQIKRRPPSAAGSYGFKSEVRQLTFYFLKFKLRLLVPAPGGLVKIGDTV